MGTGRCRVVVRIDIELHWRWIGCRTTRIGNHHHHNNHHHTTTATVPVTSTSEGRSESATPSTTTTTEQQLSDTTRVPVPSTTGQVSESTSAATSPRSWTEAPTSTSTGPVAPTPDSSTTGAAPAVKAPAGEWKPTEDPNATVVPGQMRSDRQEIPEGFTKADADKAETMEARQQMSRMASPGCQVYWPSPYQVCGAIKDKYNSLGGPNSFLLWPTTNELVNPDGFGRRSLFQNGPIYWSATSGAHPVVNHFHQKWGQYGYEAGWLRYPTTDEIVLNGGRMQIFQGGSVYWTPLTGAHSIGGSIRTKWGQTGWEGGILGFPTTDELVNPDQVGRRQGFERGVIYWSPATGAHPVTGLVLYVWESAGFEAGQYGYPTGSQVVEGEAIRQPFQGDSISFGTANPVSQKLYDCTISTEHPHRSDHYKWTVNVETKATCKHPKKKVEAWTTLVGPVDCVRGILMMGCAQPAKMTTDSVGDGVNAEVQKELKFETNMDCVPGDYYAYTRWEITNEDGGVIEHGPVYTPNKTIGKSAPYCQEKPGEK